jgi:hypothetical protein
MVSLLWRTRQTIPVSPFVCRELKYLHTYLHTPTNPWAISIGHLVPREHTFTTTGDASNLGGGAYCEDLLFWFSLIWSPEIRRRLSLHKKHADRIYINCLEFAVTLLQLAAVITRLEAAVPGKLGPVFPTGYPDVPLLLCRTDNMSTKSWANKVSSASPHAHGLNDYCHRDQCRHAFNRGRHLGFGPGEACKRSTTVVIPFSSRWRLCGPPCSRIHRPANPIPLALEIRCLYGQFA